MMGRIARGALFLGMGALLSLGLACGDDGSEPTVADVDGGGDGGSAAPDASLADPNCAPLGSANGNGKHNDGRNCVSTNCHDGQGKPPGWTLAGTLYEDKEGSAPVAGGTMIFSDANGKEIRLVTARNGNFYTLEPLVFPLRAKASICPNTVGMPDEITESMAGCNATGCHSEAGSRIFVPK